MISLHLCFASLPDHWNSVVILSQLLVMEHFTLENNEFQNKDGKKFFSKKLFCGCILYFGKIGFQWLSLVSHKGEMSQMPNLIIFITVFLPDTTGRTLFGRTQDSPCCIPGFQRSRSVCCAAKLQNLQTLLRKMKDFNKYLPNPAP